MEIKKERLAEYLDYSGETGIFTWVKSSSLKTRIGARAGWVRTEGNYRQIGIFGKVMYEHRLAWIFVHGEIPDGMSIDHINGNKSDNRIANLRLATPSQNLANIKEKKDNTSGCKNVHWCNTSGRWVAKVKRGGRTKYVGSFRDYVLAVEAATKARVEVFGEFASQLGCGLGASDAQEVKQSG